MVGVPAEPEDRPVDAGQLLDGRCIGIDRLALEVGRDGHGPRYAVEADDRHPGVQPGPQVARDRARVQGRHDGSVACPVGGERAGEQLPTHAAGLRLGEDEELGQLAHAVPNDRPRIPDRAAGDLVLRDPPRIAGRRQVVEQRPAGVPGGRIASRGIRGATRAPSEIVDGPLEDVEADA